MATTTTLSTSTHHLTLMLRLTSTMRRTWARPRREQTSLSRWAVSRRASPHNTAQSCKKQQPVQHIPVPTTVPAAPIAWVVCASAPSRFRPRAQHYALSYDFQYSYKYQNKRADNIAPSLGARERRDEERAIFLLAHLPPAPHRKQKQVAEAVIGRIAP